MPKPNQPNEETHPETVDAHVVSLKSAAQVSKGPRGRQKSDDRGPTSPGLEPGESPETSEHSSAETSDAPSAETSERWASAILSLMHVERSRFQDQPIDIPRVHIASLEAIGRPHGTSTGSAHTSITLRTPRSVQTNTAQEASKIHTLQSLVKPKS